MHSLVILWQPIDCIHSNFSATIILCVNNQFFFRGDIILLSLNDAVVSLVMKYVQFTYIFLYINYYISVMSAIAIELA